MTRNLGLLALAVSFCAACGGRTTLSDSPLDASAVGDSGVIGSDGGIVPPPHDAGVGPYDGSVAPPFDGGPPTVDGGAPGGPIQCGNTVCNASTETCCATYGGQQLTETCEPEGQCQGAAFDCSSAASCPANEVCCASFSQQQQGASCAPACKGGYQNPQLCASDAECPQGTTCHKTPFGFKVCRP